MSKLLLGDPDALSIGYFPRALSVVISFPLFLSPTRTHVHVRNNMLKCVAVVAASAASIHFIDLVVVFPLYTII